MFTKFGYILICNGESLIDLMFNPTWLVNFSQMQGDNRVSFFYVVSMVLPTLTHASHRYHIIIPNEVVYQASKIFIRRNIFAYVSEGRGMNSSLKIKIGIKIGK